ncbi:MAG TPA: response regulator, partial [Verrucomicrobiae bacterium]|nr:response regulator [Verrucomicrobiae bacterium]
MQQGILLVDDDPGVLAVCRSALTSIGYADVTTLDDSRKVLPFLERNRCSVIFLDLMMPHLAGTDLLPQLAAVCPGVPVVVMTASDDVKTAVTCMKLGAFDFLLKPVNVDLLAAAIEKTRRVDSLNRENSTLREYLLHDQLKNPQAFQHMVTGSKKMRAIFQYIEVISESDQPVLVEGETGVGKELIARAISHFSGRGGKFVTVNVAGLDDTMFSDTLFGHRKGAFTGAD